MNPRHLAAVLILATATACGPLAAETPLPTVVLEGGGTQAPGASRAGVTASGRVVAGREVQLAFSVPGIVEGIHVALGDEVRRSQALLELDATTAQLELDRAQRTLREMTSAAAIAAAEQALATAQQAQDTAQKKVNSLTYPRATEAFIQNLQGEITLARRELADATRAYNHVEDLPDNDPGKARALVRMTDAQMNLNTLVGRYNWYTGQPSEIDVALTYANLHAATTAVQEAEWHLAALQGKPIPQEASGAGLAGLEAARDAVTAAQAALDSTRLVSPIDGEIVGLEISPGEYATPGLVVVVVSDVLNLQVETTDLSERDVASVEVRQAATVFIEALGIEVPASVQSISPVADLLGGDVVYKTVVELESTPPGLRAGMSAEVQFEPEP
ncbi:MAG TPA: HlyD family efflux transporter periplasmic adaptor subunit [Anaerolineales bacterium]|nr:HlyD family efflux transporter periplasmic adaptor subunit [Anaerolineales bacterium]